MDTSKDTCNCVFILFILFMFIILVILSFLETWVLQFLWNKFVPIFWTNAPILTFWEALGCVLVISLLDGIISKSSK